MIYPSEPTILDENNLNDAILELNEAFSKLTWMDNTYTIAEILTSSEGKSSTRIRGITKGRYPGVHLKGKLGNEYLNLLPDSKLGNYSYIIQESDEEIVEGFWKFSGGIVLWWDYRKIYGISDHVNRNRYNVKELVLVALKSHVFKNISVQINDIFYDPNKIYSKFDKDVIENQFLMRPYGGMRINFEMAYKKKCI